MPQEKIYKYPSPHKIQISESDLKLKFREYRDAIRENISFFDLLIIGPAWIPVFTSHFEDMPNWPGSGSTLLGFYIAIISLGSVTWILRIHKVFIRPFKTKDVEWTRRNETDPEKKVVGIKSDCR